MFRSTPPPCGECELGMKGANGWPETGLGPRSLWPRRLVRLFGRLHMAAEQPDTSTMWSRRRLSLAYRCLIRSAVSLRADIWTNFRWLISVCFRLCVVAQST
jgi:hypothetical protein